MRVVIRCFFGSVWGGGLGYCGRRGQGQENKHKEVHLVFIFFVVSRFLVGTFCVFIVFAVIDTYATHCQKANETYHMGNIEQLNIAVVLAKQNGEGKNMYIEKRKTNNKKSEHHTRPSLDPELTPKYTVCVDTQT